ncbi:MAG: hypothetical protein AAGC76_13890 [Luteibacter sp.]|uniref:hypothetical protein n=1 Tax=Luteibacter sp. TaxID=1886636 RepID=UPI00280666AE|nr:hypothetical protein [Luteibacter sp.]MDQ7996925.1 hypothetical protein [Luteibacter sp.]MDQ8049297.1 hypothetical protein [Luteibacter sp.]
MITLLAVIAAGFVLALVIRHVAAGLRDREAIKNPPVRVTEEHGWTTVATTPAPLPARVTVVSWCLALPAGWAGAALGAKVDAHSPLPLICGVAALVGCGVLITKLFKAGHDTTRLVQRKPFQVSAQGIRLPDGTLIAPGQIYAIRRGNTQSGHTVIVGGVGVVAGVSQAAAVTAHLLTQVSHTVEVEHGGRATVLAGGLTEAQANAVAMEVTRRLPGFQR